MTKPIARAREFSPIELAFLIVVPLSWAVLLWFHPDVPDPDNVYGGLRDDVTTYQIVHVGTLIFIPLMGVALYMLIRDLPGRAATISRVAIGLFVVFYTAWETVIGLATGAPILARVLLGLTLVVVSHPPPIGPFGLACFAAAVLVLYRSPGSPITALPGPRV